MKVNFAAVWCAVVRARHGRRASSVSSLRLAAVPLTDVFKASELWRLKSLKLTASVGVEHLVLTSKAVL